MLLHSLFIFFKLKQCPLNLKARLQKQQLIHEYEVKFKVSHLDGLNLKSVRTPTFYPVPGFNLAFYFELSYICDNSLSHKYMSLFNLSLWKQSGHDIPSTIKLEIAVRVNYSDETTFKNYAARSVIIDQTDKVTFPSEYSERVNIYNYNPSEHSLKMKSEILVIICQMKFVDNLPQAQEYLGDFGPFLKIAKEFSSMYEEGIFSDVKFEVGKDILEAHKAVLSCHSPVFKKMFTDEFKESRSNCVAITDFSIDHFDNFLKYLYSGEIGDKSWSAVKELYIISDKYDVQTLKKKSVHAIITCINIELVTDILDFALKWCDSEIEKCAKSFASQNIQKLVSREDWKEFVTRNPILAYDILLSGTSMTNIT